MVMLLVEMLVGMLPTEASMMVMVRVLRKEPIPLESCRIVNGARWREEVNVIRIKRDGAVFFRVIHVLAQYSPLRPPPPLSPQPLLTNHRNRITF